MLGRLFGRKPEPRREAEVPAGVRVYAIGDIHGRLDLLDRLHALIRDDWSARPADETHLVYLGDYIDRGAQSAGVVDCLSRNPFPEFRTTFLKGNHEEMILSFLQDPSAGSAWRQLGGTETLLSYRVDVAKALAGAGFVALADDLADRLPAEHAEFLATLQVSITIGDYFFCHAGVKPGVALSAQSPRDLLWIRDEFLSSRADFGMTVVHGHSPVDAPDVRPNRINIDTGAYATGRLTCLVLEGREKRFLST